MSTPQSWSEAARAAGFPGTRVEPDGLHGEIARLRAPAAELERLLRDGERLAQALRALGFSYVAVDLEEDAG
jgi:PP-loop superfamily ATP-utilizing enzyme